MVELVDASDLKSDAERRASSSLALCTMVKRVVQAVVEISERVDQTG